MTKTILTRFTLRFEPPFSHVAVVAVGEGGSLRAGDVLGEKGVVGAFCAVQRQCAAVAGGGGKSRVDERFPVVGVNQDMGNSPVHISLPPPLSFSSFITYFPIHHLFFRRSVATVSRD